jgi:hypothetical protein
MITNEYKNFEIVTDKGIETVGIRQLTLKEKEKLANSFEDIIKTNKRKEYLEISKLMDAKERNKYLVECANSNKVAPEEIDEYSLSTNGLVEIFKITANKQLDWVNISTDKSMVIPVLKAFYWTLGNDLSDIDLTENTKIDEIVPGEAQQEANFPIEK